MLHPIDLVRSIVKKHSAVGCKPASVLRVEKYGDIVYVSMSRPLKQSERDAIALTFNCKVVQD
jgi:hypothetical protein